MATPTGLEERGDLTQILMQSTRVRVMIQATQGALTLLPRHSSRSPTHRRRSTYSVQNTPKCLLHAKLCTPNLSSTGVLPAPATFRVGRLPMPSIGDIRSALLARRLER